MVFPHVVPDRDLGWGAGGYEVKRTDIEYEEWRAANAGRKDPTLIGVGYKSRAIIGKHPDGVLIVDDIHDTGLSSAQIIEDIESACRENSPNIRVATPYFNPTRNQSGRSPDFYVHEIANWLVFPHELDALTPEELRETRPEIAAIIERARDNAA